MNQTITRSGVMIIGLGLCGAACAMAAEYMVSPRGAPGPTILQAQSPVTAGLAVLICFGVAAVIAGAVARVVNSAVGMFVLGGGLFVLAGRLETVAEVAFGQTTYASRTVLALVALETFLWAALALGGTWIVFRIGGPLRDIEPDASGTTPHPLWSAAALKSAATGLVILPAVLIIARSPMKGQMIGAVLLGSMVVGLIGRLVAPNIQPMLLFASPIFFGAVGHLAGMWMLDAPLDEAFVAGRISALSLPMPIDYAAGSLWGVSWGLGWARSFLHHDDHEHAAVASAS